MKIKLAGIIRKKEYSQGHEINDYMILYETTKILKALGAEIKLYYEKDLANLLISEEFIFSMVLGHEGINILHRYEQMGKMIINPSESISLCYRKNMVEVLEANNIPFPKSILVSPMSLNGEVRLFNSEKIWMKESELDNVESDDQISMRGTEKEIKERIRNSISNPNLDIILQEHLKGDTIKFYGVRDTGFFHFYKSENNNNIEIDNEKLKQLAAYTAEVMKLYIYGGDAIIQPDGSIYIIDMNNWPSFAPIRKKAAVYIANLIYTKSSEFFPNVIQINRDLLSRTSIKSEDNL